MPRFLLIVVLVLMPVIVTLAIKASTINGKIKQLKLGDSDVDFGQSVGPILFSRCQHHWHIHRASVARDGGWLLALSPHLPLPREVKLKKHHRHLPALRLMIEIYQQSIRHGIRQFITETYFNSAMCLMDLLPFAPQSIVDHESSMKGRRIPHQYLHWLLGPFFAHAYARFDPRQRELLVCHLLMPILADRSIEIGQLRNHVRRAMFIVSEHEEESFAMTAGVSLCVTVVQFLRCFHSVHQGYPAVAAHLTCLTDIAMHEAAYLESPASEFRMTQRALCNVLAIYIFVGYIPNAELTEKLLNALGRLYDQEASSCELHTYLVWAQIDKLLPSSGLL
jgi:hypothetical protein